MSTGTAKHFTGAGAAGNWNDPANWGGQARGAGDLAIVAQSASESGSFTAGALMLLGQEQVVISGAIHTLLPDPCRSFMVCDNAVATLTPGASIQSGGGVVVGNEGVGTLFLDHATIQAVDSKIGNLAVASGAVTMTGGSWTVQQEFVVGHYGTGTLSVMGGTISVGQGFTVGRMAGATGHVSLDGGSITAGVIAIGPVTNGTHGAGSVDVSGGGILASKTQLGIGPGSSLTLADGTVSVAGTAKGLDVSSGGTLSGHGAVLGQVVTLEAGGLIEAQGGTLSIAGTVAGGGEIAIEAQSTVVLTGAKIGAVQIAFSGSGAALDLAHGVLSGATISGFGAGDSLVMPGVDALSWNGAKDVLTLSQGGHVMDELHMAGSWGAADPFTISQIGAGALITLAPHS